MNHELPGRGSESTILGPAVGLILARPIIILQIPHKCLVSHGIRDKHLSKKLGYAALCAQQEFEAQRPYIIDHEVGEYVHNQLGDVFSGYSDYMAYRHERAKKAQLLNNLYIYLFTYLQLKIKIISFI